MKTSQNERNEDSAVKNCSKWLISNYLLQTASSPPYAVISCRATQSIFVIYSAVTVRARVGVSFVPDIRVLAAQVDVL
jgi:hypothetical protein